MKKIAVLGHGVVGSGVCELFYEKREEFSKKLGEEICLKYILVRRDYPDAVYQELFTRNFDDILNDDEVAVVAEVMGGVDPAYPYVKSLLEKGKSVVTSNKQLVAEKGAELLKIAKEHNVIMTAGSDAHRTEDIAGAAVISPFEIKTADDYLNLLKSGEAQIMKQGEIISIN